MKKSIAFFLILLCLLFNMTIVSPLAQIKNLKEGFYRVTDLNFSPINVYTIQNVSFDNRVYVLIFDENQVLQQSIRLRPQSQKYDLVPLQSDYRIVVVGDGEVIIS